MTVDDILNHAVDITCLRGPCVYFVFNGGLAPIYIGKGASVGRAMESLADKKGLSVRVLLCPDNDFAAEMERALIDKLRPILNKVIPKTKTKPGGVIGIKKPVRHDHKLLNEVEPCMELKPCTLTFRPEDVSRIRLMLIEHQLSNLLEKPELPLTETNHNHKTRASK